MKKRYLFLILCLAAFACMWAVLRASKQSSPPNEPEENRPSQVETPRKQDHNLADSSSNSIELEMSNFVATAATRQQQREELQRQSFNDWKTPIEFYGKVVDEKGNPVADAAVNFGCNDLSSEGHTTYEGRSDTDGLFSLRDITGKFLSVQVSKTGYYTYRSNPYGFTYAGENINFTPDWTQPVVFKLRKKGQAEPLITTTGRLKVSLTNMPIEWSVLTGKQEKTPERIVFERQMSSKQKGSRKYDWSLKLTLPNGGLIETRDEFLFLAPESGYQPEIVIAMSADQPDGWESMIQRSFYFRLNDGRYGRFNISFIANNGVLRIDSCLNPSGSRNLEYDEAVQPKPAVSE